MIVWDPVWNQTYPRSFADDPLYGWTISYERTRYGASARTYVVSTKAAEALSKADKDALRAEVYLANMLEHRSFVAYLETVKTRRQRLNEVLRARRILEPIRVRRRGQFWTRMKTWSPAKRAFYRWRS